MDLDLIYIDDLDIKGKRVLIRVDFRAVLATINYEDLVKMMADKGL